MPKIAEIKEIDGQIWTRLEMHSSEGAVTLWTQEEIAEYRRACVRDFLIDLFDQWKDRL